jgi:hypothetical protein
MAAIEIPVASVQEMVENQSALTLPAETHRRFQDGFGSSESPRWVSGLRPLFVFVFSHSS